ncbi:MAG: nitroreductase family deazaflavin-dependent oxidoreductase [Deltaproteobacteria bacterium]|nr:nitroreductase family deazaflavin-dependent oxidoreductase [Deltaproteobacteria bacterium]
MSEDQDTAYVKVDLALIGDEHVRRYRETDGEVGYLWNGATCLVLTTRGHKSGAMRDIPLICGFDGDDCVVVASKGGAPDHPIWYRNLVADPNVQVQLKADRFRAVARTAEGAERDRLWKIMTDVWPNYEQYRERTTRIIPVVVLERVEA